MPQTFDDAEPYRGYAHVLALTNSLDRAVYTARRAAKDRKIAIHIGHIRSGCNMRSLGQYAVWIPISGAEASKLHYDEKLHTMPWLDVREMAEPIKFTFEPPVTGRRTKTPRAGNMVPAARAATQWADRDILDAIAKRHGLTPAARDRAFELAENGYIDVSGTWKLTAKGRRLLAGGR